MNVVLAFLLGVREFRLSFTTAYDDPDLGAAYDRGREFAHKITLRQFEEGAQ